MRRIQALGALALACVFTLAGAPEPAHAGSTQRLQSQDAAWKKDADYRALKQAFQKVAGPSILTDGHVVAWVADPDEVADSSCELAVGHKSWGKQMIDVSYAVCDSITVSTLGYSVLLSRDKKHLGLILLDGGGSSGRMSYELIIFKRTNTPVEAGREDYYRKIRSVYN